MRKIAITVLCATSLACPWAQAQTRGLTTAPNALGGPIWQARFERDASALPARSAASPLGSASAWLMADRPMQSLRLLGDYQFDTLRLGQTGGLRLTGGLLINLRQAAGGMLISSLSAQPYAGVGYASGSFDGRWGFSADLGVAAAGPALLRLDRPVGSIGNMGNASLDGLPRLLPMLRLGMSLAF